MVRPNGPYGSRHRVVVETDHRARFGTRRVIERMWTPLAGVAWPAPPWERYDLTHSFNAIPLTDRPWVTTFESVLPRTLGPGGRWLGERLRERLTSESCRALIAMSQYARGRLVKAQQQWSGLAGVLQKVVILYPHVDARPASVRRYVPGEVLRLVFVGNDFARKGGIVALRAVARLAAGGLPVHLDIVSAGRVGGSIYTDHPDRSRYDADLQMLGASTVTMHGRVPHARAMELLAGAHVQLLPTMDDTFGYSVIEGFAVGTPVVATNVCALPELVPSATGVLVELPVDAWGQWVELPTRDTPGYWERLDAAYNRLTDQVVAQLMAVYEEPERVSAWSEGALGQYRRRHESAAAGARLDALYDRAVLHGVGRAESTPIAEAYAD
jgi:glycosyltransferase involved in cell wall biosynthesis